jgi:hypothetical protein
MYLFVFNRTSRVDTRPVQLLSVRGSTCGSHGDGINSLKLVMASQKLAQVRMGNRH